MLLLFSNWVAELSPVWESPVHLLNVHVFCERLWICMYVSFPVRFWRWDVDFYFINNAWLPDHCLSIYFPALPVDFSKILLQAAADR